MPFASRYHQIAAEVQHVISHPGGALGRIIDAEIALGCNIVPVGTVIPFELPECDWLASAVSMRMGEVFLVLLHARSPGAGALHRLIHSIQAAGLVPVIVEPMFALEDSVRRWGWQCSYSGDGFDRREEWRPNK